MPRVLQGDPVAPDGRLAIVVSRYNDSVTNRLLSGALDTLTDRGVNDAQIDVVWVPGAWEIPLATQRLAASDAYQALICLGAVIRGETTHDEYINRAVSTRLAEIATQYTLPVLFGMLTCQSMEQALQRAGGRHGNKGSECAAAALELVDLLTKLPPAAQGETIRKKLAEGAQ